MAAFGASAVNASRKRMKATAVATKNMGLEVITYSFVIPASSTVAGPIDLVGFELPPGALVIGGSVLPSATLGTSTLAFQTKTAGAVIGAAAVVTAERALTVTTPLAVPSTATANDVVQCTLAAATSPAADVTVTVMLVIAPSGSEANSQTTYTA